MKRLDGITDSTDMSLTRCPARQSPCPSPSGQPHLPAQLGVQRQGTRSLPTVDSGPCRAVGSYQQASPAVWTGTWGWAQGSPILLSRDQKEVPPVHGLQLTQGSLAFPTAQVRMLGWGSISPDPLCLTSVGEWRALDFGAQGQGPGTQGPSPRCPSRRHRGSPGNGFGRAEAPP